MIEEKKVPVKFLIEEQRREIALEKDTNVFKYLPKKDKLRKDVKRVSPKHILKGKKRHIILKKRRGKGLK